MTTHEPVCRPPRSLRHALNGFQVAIHSLSYHILQKLQETQAIYDDHYGDGLKSRILQTLPAPQLRLGLVGE